MPTGIVIETPTDISTITPSSTPVATNVPTTTIPNPECTPPTVEIEGPSSVQVGDTFSLSLVFQNTESEWWYVDQNENDPILKAIGPSSKQQFEVLQAGTVKIRAGAVSDCAAPVSRSITIVVADSPSEEDSNTTCIAPKVAFMAPESIKVGDTFQIDLAFEGTGSDWWHIDQDAENPLLEAIIPGESYQAVRPGTVTFKAGLTSSCGLPDVEKSVMIIIESIEATSSPATPIVTPTPAETLTPIPAPTITPDPQDTRSPGEALVSEIYPAQQSEPVSTSIIYAITLENREPTQFNDVVLVFLSDTYTMDLSIPGNRQWEEQAGQIRMPIGNMNGGATLTTIFYVDFIAPKTVVTEQDNASIVLSPPNVAIYVGGEPVTTLIPRQSDLLTWCCLPVAQELSHLYLPIITRR